MISGTSLAKAGVRPARVLALLPALVLLSGCEPDPYPATMTYSARADLLVVQANGKDIPQTFGPGGLANHLADLRAKTRRDPNNPDNAVRRDSTDNFVVVDPAEVDRDARKQIAEELQALFGTPAHPYVDIRDPAENPTFVRDLQLDDDSLAQGSRLYRRHCLHCHGVSGDGRGPTSPWVNPPPRDYRRGQFKFMSVAGSKVAKPTRDDLLHTLTEGIEGTSMPTFKAQPRKDLEALVSYVIHLSLRGSAEFDALEQVAKNSEDSKDIPALVKLKARDHARDWKYQSVPLEPLKYPYTFADDSPEFKASAARGYELFIGKGICITCHTDFGRQPGFIYDTWGTLVRPNNLTQGVYRGGRRPVDLYYRIHAGINPSTMPGAVEEIAKDPKQMWDLVNFVRVLPHPAMLSDDVKQKVYGPSR